MLMAHFGTPFEAGFVFFSTTKKPLVQTEMWKNPELDHGIGQQIHNM